MSATGTAAVVRTEARLFAREPGSLFWILLFPSLLLVAVGLVPSFRVPEESLGGQRVIDLYASVCVVLAMIMAAVSAMPPVLAGYRDSGVLRRLRTTPMHPGALLGAQVGLHVAAVLVATGLALATARLGYGVSLPAAPGWYAVSLLLATAAAFAVGAVVAALAVSTRVVSTVSTAVLFPMMFTAGVWMPEQTMDGWLRQTVVLSPMGAASEALTASLQGTAPALVDLAVLGAWTVLLSLVAVRSFRWE